MIRNKFIKTFKLKFTNKNYVKDTKLNKKEIILLPIKFSKENITIQNLKYKFPSNEKSNKYHNLTESQISQISYIAIKEVRLCKSRQELLKIQDKYKGLESFSKIYKKVITDRFEILF